MNEYLVTIDDGKKFIFERIEAEEYEEAVDIAVDMTEIEYPNGVVVNVKKI